MLADLGQRHTFSSIIAPTNLRPDLVLWSNFCWHTFLVEVTVPWEDATEKGLGVGLGQKKLGYADHAAKAEEEGLKVEMHPV